MLSKQQYLDLLVQTSRKGMFPSQDGSGCLYRGPNGRKCAVGLLVPDECFDRSMNSLCASTLFQRRPELQSIIPDGMKIEDMTRIQRIHDTQPFETDWNHDGFVSRLLALECFQGLKPSVAAAQDSIPDPAIN